MSAPELCMLFSPPEPPQQLRPGESVLIGRSRACRLRVTDGDASRRHAEILSRGDRFAIRDLGSTNGTFVNGQRVDERLLEPGDTIRIGSRTITFCQVGVTGAADDTARGEDQTLLVERPASGEVFRGDLSEIPGFAVLQILEMGRKTGVLRIDSVGQLWLEGGHPVHAETKDQRGFDAAVTIVNEATGRFTFEPQLPLRETTIRASVTELLLEASRIQDEQSATSG